MKNSSGSEKKNKTEYMCKESDFHISRHMIGLQYITFIWRFIWKQVLLLSTKLQGNKGELSLLSLTSDSHEL